MAAFAIDPLDTWDSFVRSRFQYRDEDREVIRTIPFMLETLEARGVLEGDCDCISTFQASGILALGYPARFVAIRTEEDNPEFLHVYCEAREGASWRRFDVTVDRGTVNQEIEYGRLVEYV